MTYTYYTVLGVDKRCPRCDTVKPLSEFYRQTNGHYSSYCRPCNNEYARAHNRKKYAEDPEFRARVKARARQWEIDNPERKRERRRSAYDPAVARDKRRSRAAARPDGHADEHRNSRYGITRSEFDAMVAAQESACKICRKPFAKTPRIDHVRDTKVVRGLLCDHCNRGLGFFFHEPEFLIAAAQYLQAFADRDIV